MNEHAPVELTIDLQAIAENYRMLTAKVSPAECGAAVKADAYGLGMERVAPALLKAGCRTFFVATLDEGIALRALLPDSRIFVLNGLQLADPREFGERRLRPALCSLREIEQWVERYANDGKRAKDSPVPAPALHFDTGISRLGIPRDEAQRLMADPAWFDGLKPALLMSHLACSDDLASPMNARQLQRFTEVCGRLALPVNTPRSVAASGGIFLGMPYHLELVRAGAALYGLAPLNNQSNPMRQAIRLQAKILQVRRVDDGDSVGYGATRRFDGPARLATIGVGYADGYMRSLSNRGAVHVGGAEAPVVGRVSMDLAVIDVTGLPEGATQVGAPVDLLGPQQTADELGERAGTIGYEVLTSLGRRYRRIYIDGGAA
ncbi:MAG TPA: alanine racemase [Verrucomicrobiae bacterium]|nr:alanine racemase [Verrucomicrobiae bacterium]